MTVCLYNVHYSKESQQTQQLDRQGGLSSDTQTLTMAASKFQLRNTFAKAETGIGLFKTIKILESRQYLIKKHIGPGQK